MNIEEKDLPKAIRKAAGRITEFHACSSDRGTPGEDHVRLGGHRQGARTTAATTGSVVIEAFTPKIKEIARAVSIWRPLAESEDALATNGLRHLKTVFGHLPLVGERPPSIGVGFCPHGCGRPPPAAGSPARGEADRAPIPLGTPAMQRFSALT